MDSSSHLALRQNPPGRFVPGAQDCAAAGVGTVMDATIGIAAAAAVPSRVTVVDQQARWASERPL